MTSVSGTEIKLIVPGGTIFDAVERLGLKLEPRKLTVETVMVDKVSKTPTEN